MTSQRNSSGSILSTLFAYCVVWTYLYLGVAAGYLGNAIYYPVKNPLTRFLRLKQLSPVWVNWGGVVAFIQFVCGFTLLLMISSLVQIYQLKPDQFWHFQTLQWIFTDILVLLSAALPAGLNHWLRQYYNDADVQREVAGWKAEAYVAKLLDSACRKQPGWNVWHVVLLVFNADQENEFSVEIDHLVISPHQVYLVETKCKSGVISATADTPTWGIKKVAGEDRMRNALLQVKHTAHVLKRQIVIPVPVIPLVAIYGHAALEDNPSNVCLANDVIQAISTFEKACQSTTTTTGLFEQIQAHRNNSTQAMATHIVRAKAAQQKAHQQQFIEDASIE